MHYHLEIIMPPTPGDQIEKRVSEVLEEFDETFQSEDYGGYNPNAFWDFWVIGGRYTMSHLTSPLDPDKLSEFDRRMHAAHITISGVQFGKQEISPASQIPTVDAIWKEIFPDFPGDHCPLFKHGSPSDQYTHNTRAPDVLTIAGLPEGATAFRVMIASPHDYESGEYRPDYMCSQDVWNGVVYEPTAFDGVIQNAIDAHHKDIQRFTDGARERMTVRPDWLAVTVDYHS